MISLAIILFSSFALAAEYAGLVEFSTASPRLDSRDAPRDIDATCFTSIYSKLSPPMPTNTAFKKWVTNSFSMPACTITAPSSFSEEFLSYDKELSTWLSTVESVASGIHTKCDADTVSYNFSAYCTTSRTILFTQAKESDVASARETTTTVLPKYESHSVIYIDVAGRSADVSHLLPVVVIASSILVLVL